MGLSVHGITLSSIQATNNSKVKSIYIDIQVRAVDDSLNIEDANKKDTLHIPIKSLEVTLVDDEPTPEQPTTETEPQKTDPPAPEIVELEPDL